MCFHLYKYVLDYSCTDGVTKTFFFSDVHGGFIRSCYVEMVVVNLKSELIIFFNDLIRLSSQFFNIPNQFRILFCLY